jgi:NADH-quinone oxidoreductase subunit L
MFHVMTHAFFKACLFLGSGSVIHAVEHAMHAAHGHHGEQNAAHTEHGDSADEHTGGTAGPDPNDPQDMRNMGGLRGKIPVTAVSMMAATAAICGIWPFAGFWSKDQILWRDWETLAGGDWVFWGVGLVTALLTAFYMTRMVMKTFFGAPRTEAAQNAHESSLAMILPIGLLAILSFITGWAVLRFDKFAEFLGPSVGPLPATHNDNMEVSFEWGTMIAIVLVMAYCFMRYRASKNNELMTPQARADHRGWTVQHFVPTAGWYNWAILNKYFVDEAYNLYFVKWGKMLATWLWRKFDVEGVDGIVNGVGALAAWSGQLIRKTQNGYVRSYAFSMVVGILAILVVVVVGAMGLHK